MFLRFYVLMHSPASHDTTSEIFERQNKSEARSAWFKDTDSTALLRAMVNDGWSPTLTGPLIQPHERVHIIPQELLRTRRRTIEHDESGVVF